MSPSPYFTIPFLLVVAILQSTAAPRLQVSGARPDLMLLSVVSWSLLAAFRVRELQYAGEPPSLLRGINDGVVWGFVGGICLDLLSTAPLGLSAVALMLAALVVGVFSVGVSSSGFIQVPLMAVIGTVTYHIVFLAGLALTSRPVFWSTAVTRVVLPSVVFNLALVPLVYGLLSLVNRWSSRERLQW
jgi:rod shape-determining protein MreD